MYSLDRTSAATVIATGMRVTPGKKYLVEGWYKRETGGTGNVKMSGLECNSAGSVTAGLNISTEAQFLTETWVYIRSIIKMGSTTSFFGIGINITNDIGYFIDLKVSRSD